jgi:SAM-dependent methyltransferase
MSHDHHFDTNRANWDDRAPLHASRQSGYQTQDYIDNKALLSNVVKYDLPRLGDLKGQRAVHLQCHIGTDTLSLSRLGAVDVVGLDFSSESIKAAKALVAETGDAVTFVEANVYDAPSLLPHAAFDLVFTGIGALCWLPDIDRWATVVSTLLAPGGTLFIREGHPILWAVDETLPEGPTIRFPYFNVRDPMAWDAEATYVDTAGTKLKATKTYIWNHGIGEIVTSLLKQGLVLERLEEHDSVPWEAMPGGQMVKRDLDEWALKERSGCMPLTYTLVARKPKA